MSQSCAPKHPSNLAHSDGNCASGWAHSRLELGAASAGRSVRTAQPASGMLVVLCMRDACTELAAAGLLLESRCRWHMCAVPPRSCDSDHDCSPEWPPRAAVWHETRTRAAGMHAEYVWPSYAAQLRRCPRVSACVPDWVCLQASCSADSQKISLLGSSVDSFGARAVLLIIARRPVRTVCFPTARGSRSASASCSADSQKISLLGWLVGGSGARAALLIKTRRSVRTACSHPTQGFHFKIVSGGG